MPFVADVPRTIDPQGEPEFRLNRNEGMVTQRDLADALDLLQRSIIKHEPTYLTYALGPFFRENPGLASGDAEYTTRQIVPTDATTFGSALQSFYMGRAGRIVGGHLISNAARSAGVARLGAFLTYADASTETIILGDCELNAANTNAAHHLMSNNQGIAFPAGSSIRPAIQTIGWAPTSADMSAWLIVSFQDV